MGKVHVLPHEGNSALSVGKHHHVHEALLVNQVGVSSLANRLAYLPVELVQVAGFKAGAVEIIRSVDVLKV